MLEWLAQDTALFAVSLTVMCSTAPRLDKAGELQVVLMSSSPRHLQSKWQQLLCPRVRVQPWPRSWVLPTWPSTSRNKEIINSKGL